MKYAHTILPAVLLMVMLQSLHAQTWFDNNPVWTNHIFFGFNGPGVEHMEIQYDTLLGGHSAKVLRRVFDFDFSNDFTDIRVARQSGDTIWCWNDPAGQYYVHYNFSLGVGDTLSVPLAWGGDGKSRYLIDSIGVVDIGGQILRFQRVKIPTNYDYFFGKALIIEKIGMTNGQYFNTQTNNTFPYTGHFFLDEPNSGATDGPEWTFCQFQNNQILYQGSSSSCAGLVAAPEAGNNPALRVMPNPFQDVFDIVLPPGQTITSLRLFNISGQNVLQITRPAETKIHAGDLPPGVYFLEIVTADHKVSTIKLAH